MEHNAEEVPVAKASSADIAADMDHHRGTYRRFLRILVYSLAGVGFVLLILFFVYSA